MNTPHKLDYICYEYAEFIYFVVKVPNILLSDIGIAQNYVPEAKDFIFNINPNIILYNEDNCIYGKIKENNLFSLADISSNILRSWVENKKFFFKFVKESVNLNLLLSDSEMNTDINVIGVLSIN